MDSLFQKTRLSQPQINTEMPNKSNKEETTDDWTDTKLKRAKEFYSTVKFLAKKKLYLFHFFY